MTKPKLVSFDSAQTLVDVNWSPARLGAEVSFDAELAADDKWAGDQLASLLHRRWEDYKKINLLRSEDAGDAFWHQLVVDWLDLLGVDGKLDTATEAMRVRLYGPEQDYFKLYPDVVNCLDALASEGVPLIILSNWDYSLHRIIKMLGIYERFDHVIASLEEGVEKPERALFEIALSRTGASAERSWHVGDNLLDDVQGAREAGWTAIHLDRDRSVSTPTQLHSLSVLTSLWTN